MSKPEREFFRPDSLPWVPVTGSSAAGAGGPGIEQKVLSLDAATGDVTRLLRFAAGVATEETISHDFWEEVWIVEGAVVDLGKNATYTAGMYACRPPGEGQPSGALLFEIRYRVPRR
jgi:hypothetical protein